MIENEQLTSLSKELSRIFALPITRSTLKEVQNLLVTHCPKESNTLFKALATGNGSEAKTYFEDGNSLQELIDRFSIPLKVAIDVHNRGEYISLATSDIITQSNCIAFLNRIRRVDGNEMQFLTDIQGTVNLLNHLLDRMQELKKNDIGKKALQQTEGALKFAQKKLEQLVCASSLST